MTLENQNLNFGAGSDYVATVDITGIPQGRTILKVTYTVIDPDTGQIMFTKTELAGIAITQQPPSAQITITFVPADTRDLLGEFDHQVRIEDDQGGQAPPVTTGTLTLSLGAPLQT